MTIPGRATVDGTRRFAGRFGAGDHFRPALGGLHLSSIGIGTYLGDADEATDRAYADAIARAVERGCNVVDSAINYRFQRSERAIGAALQRIVSSGAAL
jgi:aryl-alcohol dehydrogenase-like predicted oxidoreductase